MAVFNNNLLAGAGAQSSDSTYKIDQSIRFNASDYPKMTRTPSSAGNRRTFTFSTWIKRGALSTDQVVFGSYINTTNYFLIYFDGTSHSTDNTFRVYEYNGNVLKFWVYGTQKFRDPSAWYHFVVSVDTTNAVSNERIRLYVNGSRITDLTQNQQPSLNYETYINSTNLQTIGEFYGNYYHFDGYMAEMHLLDGYAYDPSFFGEFNDSGIWIPKEYTGSYGTNGFKIDGRDASDLGDDESGNGNDFTSYNLAAHDQVSDSPSNNFCVMSPIDFTYNTIKNGNLETIGGNNNKGGRGTMGFTSGKFYWEMLATTLSDRYPGSGVVYDEYASSMPTAYAGGGTNHGAGASHNGAKWYKQSTSGTQYGSHPSSGDIYMYALDRDNNKIFWGVNGTWRNSGDPANGTGAVASSLTHYGAWMPFVNHGSNAGASASTFNFGQDGTFAGAKTAQGNSDGNGVGNFYYSVPSGYLALCTKNLGS